MPEGGHPGGAARPGDPAVAAKHTPAAEERAMSKSARAEERARTAVQAGTEGKENAAEGGGTEAAARSIVGGAAGRRPWLQGAAQAAP